MLTITKQQAANYLLNRSGLNSNKPFLETLDDFGCIQVDPINVVARSHELFFYNRNKNFRKEDLYKALYQDHVLFEYWMQLYSIIPVSAYPYLQAIREVPGDRQREIASSWQTVYEKQHRKELQAVLAYIADNGPVSARELNHLPKGAAVHSWKGESSQKALLEFLWDIGKIQISHRKSNTKYYDLTERVLPKSVLDVEVDPDEAYKFLLESYFKYFGIVRSRLFSRSGRDRAAKLRELFKAGLKNGEIVELRIGDSKMKYFMKSGEYETLLEMRGHEHKGLNILPPLDPLVLNRELLFDAFGLFYRWEAYTPAVKRKFGYYNMPVLFEGRIVGQVDLAKNSEKDSLILNALHVRNKSKIFESELQKELHSLAKFCF